MDEVNHGKDRGAMRMMGKILERRALISISMLADVQESVYVIFDAEIESDVPTDARLPHIGCPAVFLCVQRRVSYVAHKIRNLLFKQHLHRRGKCLECAPKTWCADDIHARRSFINSSTE